MAIKASADIIGIPVTLRSVNDISKLDDIYEALMNAVNSGGFSIEQINNSVRRILDLKSKL